jgi:hypothetical protein
VIKIAILILTLAITGICEARVFDLAKEKFGSYLLFSAQQSNLKDTPMSLLTAANTFSDAYANPVGGEFGFMYEKGHIGFRFGFEVMKPAPVEGYAKAGSVYKYYYKDNTTALAPKMAMEINFKTGSWYRFLGYGYYGQASLTETTDYSGLVISPNVDHTVNAKSSAAMYGGGLAMELSIFDTTTLMIEGGYKQLKFTNISYGKDITTFDGAHQSGDTIKNQDLTNHEIDMTGAYVVVGFRFYLF